MPPPPAARRRGRQRRGRRAGSRRRAGRCVARSGASGRYSGLAAADAALRRPAGSALSGGRAVISCGWASASVGSVRPSFVASARIRPWPFLVAERLCSIEFSLLNSALTASTLPLEAAKLSVTTLRATIPTSRTPSRPIQARPRVRRWMSPDSGSWVTATAARPAVPAAYGRTRARRRGAALWREGAVSSPFRDGLRAGAAVEALRGAALRAGAAVAARAVGAFFRFGASVETLRGALREGAAVAAERGEALRFGVAVAPPLVLRIGESPSAF